MYELTDQELEQVVGGTHTFPNPFSAGDSTNSSSAGTLASASASGQNGATTSANSQSATIALPFKDAPSASFSVGFAAGIGY